MIRSSKQSTTNSTPSPGETPSTTPPFSGHHDHSFTLQAIMEMQKTLGSLETAVTGLSGQIGSQKTALDDVKKKVGHTEKVMYAAGVLLVVAIAIGGWMLSMAKDFAMVYYKASIEAQVKTTQTQSTKK